MVITIRWVCAQKVLKGRGEKKGLKDMPANNFNGRKRGKKKKRRG